MIEITSYIHRCEIWWRGTLPPNLTSWRRLDVPWRHLTSFSKCHFQKVLTSAKFDWIWNQDGIFRIQLSYINKMRGQPLLYLIWFKHSSHFSQRRVFLKNCWRQLILTSNNDVIRIFFFFENSYGTLQLWKVTPFSDNVE